MKAHTIALLVLGGLIPNVYAADEDPVRAEESSRVELLVDSSGAGFAMVKGCIACPLRLAVTPDTEYLLNDRPITLDQAKLRASAPLTVYYTKNTKQAVKFDW